MFDPATSVAVTATVAEPGDTGVTSTTLPDTPTVATAVADDAAA